jgi:hypothetical protein
LIQFIDQFNGVLGLERAKIGGALKNKVAWKSKKKKK